MKIFSNPILLTLAMMILSSTLVAAQSNNGNATPLLIESGKAEKLFTPPAAGELKIVSYNIRWRSGGELQQISRWLKEAAAAHPTIIGLQEVDRAKKRSGQVNHAKALADSLGMYYAWTAPHTQARSEEEETGVAILSPYPLTEVTRIVLPNPGPGGRVRVAIGATAQIGKTPVRLYSVHGETQLAIAKKVEQLRAVLEDLQKFSKEMPAIVLGDFNTWELPAIDSVRKLFTTAGFTTPFPDDESTFFRKALMFDVKLKLDWIWVRGLTPQSYGIDRSLTVSDHFPLWTVVTIDLPATATR
jgi:endonuclease/exonuclease/phosphatase family metal-dependent hydrolase